MSDEIRADYEQLEKVAAQFTNQSQAIQQMLQKVRASFDKLEQDGWKGEGADAFFKEMREVVFPATTRLHQALEEAHKAAKEIGQNFQRADEEASAPFRAA